MEVFLLKSSINEKQPIQQLSELGIVNIINPFFEQNGLKKQHLTAWSGIVQKNLESALIIKDCVSADYKFINECTLPINADIAILSSPKLRISGIVIPGNDWVIADGEDPLSNNIFDAYIITRSGAQKLYDKRYEMMDSNNHLYDFLKEASEPFHPDRINLCMTFNTRCKMGSCCI